LEMADELNLLSSIDALVLEQSLDQMRRWRQAGIVVPKVSVNVSSKRLSDPGLGASIKKLKFKPGTLTFELVESTFLDQQSDQVAWNIDQIREAGIEIEIDDFGTGHASIVGLTHLRPKRLKIDRQLILPITDSKAQQDLVRSIVQIGHSLGIESIAEGVETMEHARILHKLGCEGLQGYVFAKPMSGKDFGAFARARSRETAKGRQSA
jgi:EAL domain-containing protein (putative c-di-GMP-specific phosphodiesterase class I)